MKQNKITKKPKGPQRSSFFSLLELLVCFMILAIAGGAITWNLKGVYETSKLEGTMQQLFGKLQECRSLCLSYQIDVTMELIQQEDGLAYRITTDEPLKGYNKSLIALHDQCRFTFKGKPANSLLLHFGPSGWLENRGVMEIDRQGSKRWIDLRTAPQISLCKEKPRTQWPTDTLPQYPGKS